MNIYEAGQVFRRNVCQYTHAESGYDIFGWHFQCKDKPSGCGFTVALIWHKSSPCLRSSSARSAPCAGIRASTGKETQGEVVPPFPGTDQTPVASLGAATTSGCHTPLLPPAELPGGLWRCRMSVSPRCWGRGELRWLWGRTNATATAEELLGEPVWPSAPKHCPAPKTCWYCLQKTESWDKRQAVGERSVPSERCPVPPIRSTPSTLLGGAGHTSS